jgi:hypothetical protein
MPRIQADHGRAGPLQRMRQCHSDSGPLSRPIRTARGACPRMAATSISGVDAHLPCQSAFPFRRCRRRRSRSARAARPSRHIGPWRILPLKPQRPAHVRPTAARGHRPAITPCQVHHPPEPAPGVHDRPGDILGPGQVEPKGLDLEPLGSEPCGRAGGRSPAPSRGCRDPPLLAHAVLPVRPLSPPTGHDVTRYP